MGRLVLPLPRLEVPTAEMMATIYLPEGKTYVSFGGDMERIGYFTYRYGRDKIIAAGGIEAPPERTPGELPLLYRTGRVPGKPSGGW